VVGVRRCGRRSRNSREPVQLAIARDSRQGTFAIIVGTDGDQALDFPQRFSGRGVSFLALPAKELEDESLDIGFEIDGGIAPWHLGDLARQTLDHGGRGVLAANGSRRKSSRRERRRGVEIAALVNRRGSSVLICSGEA